LNGAPGFHPAAEGAHVGVTTHRAQQLGQPHLAVQVHAIIGRVLGDDDQLADAVAGQLAGLADDLLDRLGDVLAAHAGDGAEAADAVGIPAAEEPECSAQPRRASTGSAKTSGGRGFPRRSNMVITNHPECLHF